MKVGAHRRVRTTVSTTNSKHEAVRTEKTTKVSTHRKTPSVQHSTRPPRTTSTSSSECRQHCPPSTEGPVSKDSQGRRRLQDPRTTVSTRNGEHERGAYFRPAASPNDGHTQSD
ncbi:hypothetical protein L226DRAFT_346270 [Lentinus tigrinus ALCF2SS1-7]|uniref:uncharacterized protein n=1 Tax=Lentinus tigrinus ALCF2SS1-7 TaxID=1328758 RepID=UPI0011662DFC|nr:hypothetical protein L226DRAFT_346270 [Lentinus tigrinus ALCF2SS1-7]